MQSSNQRSLRAFLNRLNSRSALTADEQQAVLDLPGTAIQVRPNRDFVPLGKRVDHSCLVVSGIVGRFKQDRDGRRQITMLHIPGDMCDLHSVVEPVATSALQALSNATILQVPHEAIRVAAARYPALSLALWRDCMVDSAIIAEWVMNIGRRDARERVAHLFCEMATRLASDAQGNSLTFELPITQAHVADATGLTPVHVNRTLQGLRSDGLLDWKFGKVEVFKWEELKRVAQFDPTYLFANMKPVRGGAETSAVEFRQDPSTIVVT